MVDLKKLEEFLNTTVPYTGGEDWLRWQESCNSLGADAEPYLLDALKNGPAFSHHAAMLALRMRGFKIGAHGNGRKTIYKYQEPTSRTEESIIPAHPPPDWDDPENQWYSVDPPKA